MNFLNCPLTQRLFIQINIWISRSIEEIVCRMKLKGRKIAKDLDGKIKNCFLLFQWREDESW